MCTRIIESVVLACFVRIISDSESWKNYIIVLQRKHVNSSGIRQCTRFNNFSLIITVTLTIVQLTSVSNLHTHVQLTMASFFKGVSNLLDQADSFAANKISDKDNVAESSTKDTFNGQSSAINEGKENVSDVPNGNDELDDMTNNMNDDTRLFESSQQEQEQSPTNTSNRQSPHKTKTQNIKKSTSETNDSSVINHNDHTNTTTKHKNKNKNKNNKQSSKGSHDNSNTVSDVNVEHSKQKQKNQKQKEKEKEKEKEKGKEKEIEREKEKEKEKVSVNNLRSHNKIIESRRKQVLNGSVNVSNELITIRKENEGLKKLWNEERSNCKKAYELLKQQKEKYNKLLSAKENSHSQEYGMLEKELQNAIKMKDEMIDSLKEEIESLNNIILRKEDSVNDLNNVRNKYEREINELKEENEELMIEHSATISKLRQEFEKERQFWEKEKNLLNQTKNTFVNDQLAQSQWETEKMEYTQVLYILYYVIVLYFILFYICSVNNNTCCSH